MRLPRPLLDRIRIRAIFSCYSMAGSSQTTQILHCDASSITFGSSDEPEISSQATLYALRQAAEQLKRLQTVAFPTETVYGLGALALDSTAASRIFSTKGRPPDNPLIVHVSSIPMLHKLLPRGYTISKTNDMLMRHFWPGPLTLLFPADPALIPSIITANQLTVAIRMPSHPVARALIALTDAPIAAPSANSSGRPSPTRAEHVFKDLGGKVGLILDGGPCGVGLESTVVEALNEDGNIRILRPGGVTVEDIEGVIQQEMGSAEHKPKVFVYRRDYHDESLEQAPTTPGMKYRHYSPAVPVILLRTSPPQNESSPVSIPSFLASVKQKVKLNRPIKIGLLAPSDSPILSRLTAPTDGIVWHTYPLGPISAPAISAQRLFDGLLTLDNAGVDLILVEGIEEEREGLAVMNRVNKAASEIVWIDQTA